MNLLSQDDAAPVSIQTRTAGPDVPIVAVRGEIDTTNVHLITAVISTGTGLPSKHEYRS